MKHLAVASTALAFAALSCAASCSSAPVTEEKVAVVSSRLLAPYLGGTEVGCDELVVEMTANFYPNVGRPSTDPRLHKVVRTRKDGFDETTYLNLTGAPEGAFVVTVGELDSMGDKGWVKGKRTTFTVLQAFTMRTPVGTHEYRLDAEAKGAPFVREDGKVRDLREFRIRDGMVHAR
ncbi:MAG: hypothetical protein RL148_3019 [Planctomycetota bacterium]|jgi:hypothetical protein